MRYRLLPPIVIVAALVSGCVSLSSTPGFDDRPLTVQTLGLFDQRASSRLVSKSWKGDWVFRRDRLELVDKGLRNIKPDLLLLQQLVKRIGSFSESDSNILSAGALADYDWRLSKVRDFEDTRESTFLAIAVGPPLSFKDAGTHDVRQAWTLGTDGYLMVATVMFDGQPLTVFNVQMPSTSEDDDLWYGFLQERIEEQLKVPGACMARVLVAGYLPGGPGVPRYDSFVRTLGLKDASSGFCQVASDCYTATPINEIFMATVGDESPQRLDRILVHDSVHVYSSGRNFVDTDPNNHYGRQFGLSRLWASQRFGWQMTARFPKCPDRPGPAP